MFYKHWQDTDNIEANRVIRPTSSTLVLSTTISAARSLVLLSTSVLQTVQWDMQTKIENLYQSINSLLISEDQFLNTYYYWLIQIS